jgi:RNA polymerase sigma-70 factor (ECF subfamily)
MASLVNDMASESLEGGQNQRTEEFVQLLLRNQANLFAYLVTLLTDPLDAEEVLQRASVVMWRKFSEYAPGTHFAQWGMRIAHYEALHFLRAKRRERVHFASDTLAALASDYEAAQAALAAERLALARCLEKLNPDDRRIIDQRYLLDISVKDLAAALGRPLKSIYRSLARIRQNLLECMRRARLAEDRA